MTEILTPISIDHSLVLFSPLEEKDCIRGKGFWKFNSWSTKDQNYMIEIRNLIGNFLAENKSYLNHQLKCELLKYEVRNFTIHIQHIHGKDFQDYLEW